MAEGVGLVLKCGAFRGALKWGPVRNRRGAESRPGGGLEQHDLVLAFYPRVYIFLRRTAPSSHSRAGGRPKPPGIAPQG